MGQIGYASGFAQQVRYGPGNVDVIVPWPDGGFAIYWLDMTIQEWKGPYVCSGDFKGQITSLSWHEGDYRSHHDVDDDHYNYEMVAVEGSTPVHWWRENRPPYRWTRQQAFERSVGHAVLGRTHKNPNPDWKGPLNRYEFHQDLSIYGTLSGGGLIESRRNHSSYSDLYWTGFSDVSELTSPTSYDSNAKYARIGATFSGIAFARGTVAAVGHGVMFGEPWDTSFATDYEIREFAYDGKYVLVGVRTDGTFVSYDQHQRSQVIGTGLRGRPAVLQTDRGREDPFFGQPVPGHYEAFAPGRDGGVRHFWRPNNGPDTTWRDAGVVGTELYDEVSAIQLADDFKPSDDETSPVWLFARIDGEPWVDWFVQRHTESGFYWEQQDSLGDPNRSEVWEVTCVKTHTPPGGGRRIIQLGGEHLGLPFRLDKATAIADIRNRRRRFLTRAPDGRTAWVNVVAPMSAPPYLVTSLDLIVENNLTALPECPSIPPPPDPVLPFPVTGLIEKKWQQLGGWKALGLPTGPEHAVGATGRRQTFEFGQIAHSPDQGPRMMVWAHRVHNDIEFGWGPTAPHAYDFFIVRWRQDNGLPTEPGPDAEQADVKDGLRTSGRFRRALPLHQIGSDGHHAGWSFSVEGANDGGLFSGAEAPQGWTTPLSLRL